MQKSAPGNLTGGDATRAGSLSVAAATAAAQAAIERAVLAEAAIERAGLAEAAASAAAAKVIAGKPPSCGTVL